MNSPLIAQADTAGGSPIANNAPRTPLDRATVSSNDFGDDVYVEASSARYNLDDQGDGDDEPCCWGFTQYLTCKKAFSSPLNEALLATPPFNTDEETNSSSLCCGKWCRSEKFSATERHILPRLSSTMLGFRTTPGGSNRISSPPSPRNRASSTHTEPMSVTGMPSRPLSRSIDVLGSTGGGVEVVRKIVMLGARNSGKSSVVHRFAEKRFGAAYDPTIESTIRAKIVLKGVTFMCDLLDTAGQDEYSNFSRQATVGVHGYCMVFSVTSMQSFIAIQKIHDRITELVGSYTVPTVLVGTKCDDETRREVGIVEPHALAESWGTSYIECSAKADFGIYDVFETLLHEIERDSGILASKNSESSEESKKRTSCVIS